RHAIGDLIAFLDSDDLWHPGYLQHQSRQFRIHPNAAAFFAGHVNVYGYGSYEWKSLNIDTETGIEILDPLTFFKSLDARSGFFFPSFATVPRAALEAIGSEPFRFNGVEDGYFYCRLALLGRNVVFAPAPMGAYRLHNGTMSEN